MKLTVERMKEVATDREMVFTNHISEKRLVSQGKQPEPKHLAYFQTGHTGKG